MSSVCGALKCQLLVPPRPSKTATSFNNSLNIFLLSYRFLSELCYQKWKACIWNTAQRSEYDFRYLCVCAPNQHWVLKYDCFLLQTNLHKLMEKHVSSRNKCPKNIIGLPSLSILASGSTSVTRKSKSTTASSPTFAAQRSAIFNGPPTSWSEHV